MQPQRTMRRRAVPVPCPQCGATFKPKPAEVERGKGQFCSRSCYAAARLGVEKRPADERFWEKVDKNGPVPAHRPDLGSCWLWIGHVEPTTGYGRFQVQRKTWNAHHWAYSRFVGEIPKGYDRDHLCRVRRCVNWTHLDAVPHRENVLRGKAPAAVIHATGRCARGHERTAENYYEAPGGKGYCIPCRRARRSAGCST